MPKQKKYHFKHLQGRPSTNPTHTEKKDVTPSVNERLSELRLADPASAEARKRDIADSVSQHSLPASLSGLLGMPQTAPPRPRLSGRPRDRRTPGPVPPSWLRGDTGGSEMSTERIQDGLYADGRQRPMQHELFRFEKLCSQSTKRKSSLVHSCLKRIAASWDDLEVDEKAAVLELPSNLRVPLISYVGYYGYNISFEMFTLLTANHDTIDTLDLAGLIGHDDLTLSRVTRLIRQSRMLKKAQPELDSWETDLSPSPSITDFSRITHLCLSNPAQDASWSDLLSMTKLTPAITHLSLAYWPRPSLTPNLATSVVANTRGPDVTAGGSHLYSVLDDDHAEPRNVLRQLSHNLLRLTWLDIEGNPEWLTAMTTSPTTINEDNDFLGARSRRTGFNTDHGVMTELITAWRNLSYIRCASSYMPEYTWQAVPRLHMNSQLVTYRDWIPPYQCLLAIPLDNPGEHAFSRMPDQKQSQMQEQDMRTARATRLINEYRRANKCGTIRFDCGWTIR